jgi:hypothetical protein
MLREALELLDDDDQAAALRALQRIVTRADRATIARVDELSRRLRDVPLDELLARTRMAVAEAEPGFHIRFVTPFEAAALGRALARREQALLAAVHGGRSVRSWASDPAGYTELRPDARSLAEAAADAAGIIGTRLEFDPAIRHDREARRALAALRPQLARLVGHLRSLPGFTDLPEPGAPDALATAPSSEQTVPGATTRPTSAPQASTPDAMKEHHEH